LLAEMAGLDAANVMAREDEGLPKLSLIQRALRLRQEHPEWFGRDSAYVPVYATGDNAEHVVAYLRGENVLTVAPRWVTKLAGAWEDTSLEIPQGSWMNELTGEKIEGGLASVKTLLREFPVALLSRILPEEIQKGADHA
jgi:(1->4)-alpha-D-glucan 1-alpha-D-glucosylmutase